MTGALDRLFSVGPDEAWTLATAVACCVATAVLSPFVVLRRMSMTGDAVSHSVLPGIAAAFLVTGTRDLAPTVVGATVAGVLAVWAAERLTDAGVREDAALGIVFTTFFAVGLLLIRSAARTIDLDPGCVLYGLLEFVPFDTVSVLGAEVPRTLVTLGSVAVLNVAVVTLLMTDLRIFCFDPLFAVSAGVPVTVLRYGFIGLVVLTVVASFEAVGSVLVVTMIVAPAATAHLLTDDLRALVILSALLGALAAVLGYAGAVMLDTSTAGMISVCSGALFFVAVAASPRHGLLGRRRRARAPAIGEPAAGAAV